MKDVVMKVTILKGSAIRILVAHRVQHLQDKSNRVLLMWVGTFKRKCLLHVPAALKLKKLCMFPHRMRVSYDSEYTTIISLNSTNQFVFVLEMWELFLKILFR